MILWRPSTWFEDLGLATRISGYEFESKPDYFHSEAAGTIQHKYCVTCYVRLPNGRIEQENISMPGPNFHGVFPKKYKGQLKIQLKEQIRSKYPRPPK